MFVLFCVTVSMKNTLVEKDGEMRKKAGHKLVDKDGDMRKKAGHKLVEKDREMRKKAGHKLTTGCGRKPP